MYIFSVVDDKDRKHCLNSSPWGLLAFFFFFWHIHIHQHLDKFASTTDSDVHESSEKALLGVGGGESASSKAVGISCPTLSAGAIPVVINKPS